MNKLSKLFAPIFLLCAFALFERQAFAQTTAFTYQGRFTDSIAVQPTNGIYEMEFKAFDAASGGNQIGSPVNLTAVGVTNGLVTVVLDFGANVFTGSARYLDLASRTNGSVAAFVSMTPRQPLTPVPNALYADTANGMRGIEVG